MTKKTFIFFIIAVILLLILVLLQPLQRKTKVLSVNIPNSTDQIELWEKPQFDLFTFSTEYETWFVFQATNESPRWFLIHNQYITFRKVSVFISSDIQQLRIETNGDSEETHLIAEYILKEKSFNARSEETVRNKPGWKLLVEKRVR